MAKVYDTHDAVRFRRTASGVILRVNNAKTGRQYAASIIEKHGNSRVITFFTDDLLTSSIGQQQVARLGVRLEALICRGPLFLSVTFAPTLAFYLVLPTKLSDDTFYELLGVIMYLSDLGALCSYSPLKGQNDSAFEHVCEKYGLTASFGWRRAITFRRIPSIFLMGKSDHASIFGC